MTGNAIDEPKNFHRQLVQAAHTDNGSGDHLQGLEVGLLAESRQAREVCQRVAGHAALGVGAIRHERLYGGATGLRDLLQQLHVCQGALHVQQ